MSSGPDFLTRKTTEDVEVLTTFEPRLQRAAEAGLAAVFEEKVKAGSNAQAAIVVMSPDGAVRAMVGGRRLDGTAGQLTRATQARRQTGTLFKPFVYAAALQAGASPLDQAPDAPLTICIPGFRPLAAAELHREYLGEITLAQALAGSINTATVRVAEATGRARVAAVGAGPRADRADRRRAGDGARGLGGDAARDDRRLRRYPEPRRQRAALRAARAAPQGGRGAADAGRGGAGDAGARRARGGRAGLDDGPGDRGRHRRPGAAAGRRPAAGKTGTTQAARDAWFVGFTADYVTGVWMGYDDNTPLTGRDRRRAAGRDLARDHGAGRGGAAGVAAAVAQPESADRAGCRRGRTRSPGSRRRCGPWCRTC